VPWRNTGTRRKAGDGAARKFVFERDSYKCRRCGAQPVEWCHVLTRGWRSIRHDPANSFAGCRSCHEWFDSNRKAAREWWTTIIGEEEMQRLYRAGRADRKPVSEWRRSPKDWGDKNSAGQAKRIARDMAVRTCVVCSAGFMSARDDAKYCSPKCRYAGQKTSDEFRRKAVTAGSSIRGTGKRAILEEMFRNAVGRPCTYCGTILTVSNSHIDHKTAISGLRGTPMAKLLDRSENLQIICRKCNIAKSNLDDAKFRKLIAFLRSDPVLYQIVWRRLGMQGHGWRQLKRRQT